MNAEEEEDQPYKLRAHHRPRGRSNRPAPSAASSEESRSKRTKTEIEPLDLVPGLMIWVGDSNQPRAARVPLQSFPTTTHFVLTRAVLARLPNCMKYMNLKAMLQRRTLHWFTFLTPVACTFLI